MNQDSASAAEILAAALQDNRRAELVGVNTFGKGLVQTVFPLHDGGALKLTTQKYYTPNGRDINEVGITPDYEVQNDPDSSEDLQLTKAINVLKEKLQKQLIYISAGTSLWGSFRPKECSACILS